MRIEERLYLGACVVYATNGFFRFSVFNVVWWLVVLVWSLVFLIQPIVSLCGITVVAYLRLQLGLNGLGKGIKVRMG